MNRTRPKRSIVRLWLVVLVISGALGVLAAPLNGGVAHAAEIECATAGYSGGVASQELIRRRFGFRPVAGMCELGYLHGEIIKGDYEKVSAFYRKNHPMLGEIDLWSLGGDVETAMNIGRLLRKYLVTAEAPMNLRGAIPAVLFAPEHAKASLLANPVDSNWFCRGPDCVCASACALIWFGGVERFGDVGLHRPRTDDPRFRSLGPGDAMAVYHHELEDIVSYLGEMEVPRPIIDKMVATGSSEIQWVDAEEDHLKRPPSFAEWEDASCGTFTAEEDNTLFHLDGKKEQGQLTQSEDILFKLLKEKSDKYLFCTSRFVFRQRVQLPSP